MYDVAKVIELEAQFGALVALVKTLGSVPSCHTCFLSLCGGANVPHGHGGMTAITIQVTVSDLRPPASRNTD